MFKTKIIEILNILKDESLGILNETKWIPLLSAVAALSPQIGPIIHIPYVHIPLIFLCIVMNLGRHWTVEKTGIIFLFYLPLNIIFTEPDPVFQSWSRLWLFCFIFILAAPLFKGDYIAVLRRKLFHAVLFVSTIITVGSFFCYFLGINYMSLASEREFVGSAGLFGGLSNHSMALAVFAGMSTLYCFYKSHQKKKSYRYVYWGLMAMSLGTLLFTASRSALLATVAGLLVMLYQIKKENGSFIKTLLVIILGAMLTFPLWEGAAEGVLKKQDNNEKSGKKYGSRTTKWEARFDELYSSPVFGVGFSAQDPNGKDEYDKKTGTIEPGSSWLAILSMTGIIGFILISLMLVFPFLYLKNNPNTYNAFLLGLFTFYFLSYVAEGYIFAGGNAMCFISWLVFGVANDVRYGDSDDDNEENEEESEKN